MLERLSISNYALIENLDFSPGEGLSIITGETGAGKSIMLGALSLLKGERADMKVIADKGKKAVVEASFINLDPKVLTLIDSGNNDCEWPELIIRREIYPSGRSRAFINDTPATLGQLEQLTRNLLDIHSQNSNSMLSEQSVQLQLIDETAGNRDIIEEYTTEFRKYVDLRQKINNRRELLNKHKEQSEIIIFKLGRLDKLKPKGGELRKIEARFDSLSNAEQIREALLKARNFLDGEEDGALEKIDSSRALLEDIDFSLWEEKDPEITERLRNCYVEIKDIVETVEGAIGVMAFDPSALAKLSSRMDDYYSAMKFFKVESDSELEKLHNELKKQYSSLEDKDLDTEEMEREARETAARLKKLANALSLSRKEAAAGLQHKIESEAKSLGLANLRFEIVIKESRLSKTGGDSVEYLASFNKNGEMLPVSSIASGGEMARLMLAIKKIMSGHLKLPTIIFDEIDTGVSGPIADSMGEMMREMGNKMQILTITHLPQVAVKGERHFKVYKEDQAEKTISNIMLLSEREREEEIGRMLSGEEIDEAARENARSLLNRGKKNK